MIADAAGYAEHIVQRGNEAYIVFGFGSGVACDAVEQRNVFFSDDVESAFDVGEL